MTRPLLHLSIALVALAACRKSAPHTCQKAAQRFVELANKELAKESDPERLKEARRYLPTLQNAIAETCESSKWPESVRRCMVEAAMTEDLVQCDPAVAAHLPDSSSED